MKISNLTIISNCNYSKMEEDNDHKYDKNIMILSNKEKKDIIYDITKGKIVNCNKVYINIDKSKCEDVFNIENEIIADQIESITNYRFVSLKNKYNNVLIDSFMFIEIIDNKGNKKYIDLINQKLVPCLNVELIKYDFSEEINIFKKNKDVYYIAIDITKKVEKRIKKKIKMYYSEIKGI